MNSYGELLKNSREERNMSIEDVSREITVDRRYLQALEDEESSVFPGEAYLTGYLRNYAKFLELDSEYVLKLYRNKLLQEAPVPAGLIAKSKPKYLLPVILSIVFVVLVGAGLSVFFILRDLQKKKNTDDVEVVKKEKQYELTNEKFIKRVYKGDQFVVPTENDTEIILTVAETKENLGIATPGGTFYVELSEEAKIDINGDSIYDMIVYVSDISSTDETRGAEVSILLRHGMSNVTVEADLEDIPFATEVKSKYPQRVIFEDDRAYPFTVKASFRGVCLFRDKVDKDESVETYFAKGEEFTATPQNSIRLWVSNSGAVNFTIQADSKTYSHPAMGSSGEVLVEDIKWIRDTDGKYKLVVIELD